MTQMKHIIPQQSPFKSFIRRCHKYRALLLLTLIPITYYAVFWAYPLYGLTIAFKDYKILEGVSASKWIGFGNFVELITADTMIGQYLWNSIRISFFKWLFGFPAPIIFAILLTELRSNALRRVTQTVTYLPNFLSWVVLSGIFSYLLSNSGPVNWIVTALGGNPIQFVGDRIWVQVTLVITDIWKGFGWGSIIYIATIAGIDTTQYEAAIIDGANRFQRIRYVTLPNMIPILTIQLVMSTGGILGGSFDQIFNFNVAGKVQNYVLTLDVYEYNLGITSMEYAKSTALGFAKALVSCTLIITANYVAARINGEEYTLW